VKTRGRCLAEAAGGSIVTDMDIPTTLLGALLLAYGIASIPARIAWPHSSAKLATWRKRLGYRSGTIAHAFFYTAVPLLAGAVFLIAGLRGISLFARFG
jgi:hypothetical protein